MPESPLHEIRARYGPPAPDRVRPILGRIAKVLDFLDPLAQDVADRRMAQAARTRADVAYLLGLIDELDHDLLVQTCDSYGLPSGLAGLLRHLAGNYALTHACDAQTIALLEEQLGAANAEIDSWRNAAVSSEAQSKHTDPSAVGTMDDHLTALRAAVWSISDANPVVVAARAQTERGIAALDEVIRRAT
jgi:hypothetical protein